MDDADERRLLGLIEIGRLEEARSYAARLLASDPNEPDIYGHLGHIQLARDDPRSALEAGRRHVELRPAAEWGYRLCSLALDRMGHHAAATASAAQAIRCDPANWLTHHVYASVAAETPHMLAEARAAAEQSVLLAPSEPDAHFTLGFVAHRTGDLKAARSAYHRALSLQPTHSDSLRNLAVLDSRHIRRAANGFARALEQSSGDRDAAAGLDFLVVRFAGRVHMVAVTAFVVGSVSALLDLPQWVRLVTAALLVVGSAIAVAYVLRGVPRGVRRYMVGSVRRDAQVLFTVVAAAAMSVGAVLICISAAGPLPLIALVIRFLWAAILPAASRARLRRSTEDQG